VIEYRWAQGQYDRLGGLAADLASRQVRVIAATGGEPSALAAKGGYFDHSHWSSRLAAIRSMLASSQASSRPTGNITGVTLFTSVLGAKRLEMLREPSAQRLRAGCADESERPECRDGYQRLAGGSPQHRTEDHCPQGQRRDRIRNSLRDPGATEGRSAPSQRGTRFSTVSSLNSSRARCTPIPFPATYELRAFATAGGLASYGSSITEAYRRVGIYTGQILKGAKPADLPVMQPTTFELVINLRTAKALGLTIPESLLLRADEVIE